jgi:hypothetical protein
MTATNDITGDRIQSKPVTNQYADNWEKIFGKRVKQTDLKENRDEVQKQVGDRFLQTVSTGHSGV